MGIGLWHPVPPFTTSPCDVSTGLCWVLIQHLQDSRIVFPTHISFPILRPQRLELS